MTSERRAYIIVFAMTLSSAAAAGAVMLHGGWSIACGIITAASNTFASGLAKAPREGKLSDDAEPPVVATNVASDTVTVTHAEAPKE